MPSSPKYRRRSARVLLLDGQDRLLLLRMRYEERMDLRGHYWLTPGGGVKRSESLPRAAARELAEEIGLVVDERELGRPVAQASGYVNLSWAKGYFRDDFFLHRVDTHEILTNGREAHEHDLMIGHHWWPLAELAATSETVYPFGLVPLLTELIADRIPAEPVALPWHHDQSEAPDTALLDQDTP